MNDGWLRSDALEDVASQWPAVASWEKVSYRGQERHAASPIGANRFKFLAEKGKAML